VFFPFVLLYVVPFIILNYFFVMKVNMLNEHEWYEPGADEAKWMWILIFMAIYIFSWWTTEFFDGVITRCISRKTMKSIDDCLKSMIKCIMICNCLCKCVSAVMREIWGKMCYFCGGNDEKNKKTLEANRKHYLHDMERWEKEFATEGKTDD
jgi:hypothetical protein